MDVKERHSGWQPDHLGERFEMQHIAMPDDYSGPVQCTVVRRKADSASLKAILYVHGYSDYFFQKEMADMFASNGYNFYAVDLRKYGRSQLGHQAMFQVRRLDEYFADINAALDIISGDGNSEVALSGHSTGGLTASLYMAKTPSPMVKCLMLNSPFLDWNLSSFLRRIAIPVVSMLGGVVPGVKLKQAPDRGYAESLAREFGGEWKYRHDWKPDVLPDPDAGWIRAIQRGQQQLRKLSVDVPVLLMHSARTVRKGDSKEMYKRADAILDVESISLYGKHLGADVTEVTFDGGLHDLALSKPDVRRDFYRVMLSWLAQRM